MTGDVFNAAENQDQGDQGGTGNTQNNQDTSSQDVFADKLASITTEDGKPKYTDVASALDSIPHAQAHISTLEKEAAELREKLAREQAARELLAKQLGDNKSSPAQQGLTEEQVAEIAMRTQQAAQESQKAQANVDSVNATFSELYGEKAVQQMQLIARESGMAISEIRALAAKSPQAVYRLAGINTPPQGSTPPKSPGQGSGDQFTKPKEPVVPKSVMSGSSTADMVANWHAAGEIVRNRQQ